MPNEILLYRADGLPDAYLLRRMLQDAGIEVRLAGEALTGLAGAIPLQDARPMLWVPAVQEDQARAVLARFKGPELVHPARVCPHCGEENPAGFEVCWNCEELL